MRLLFFNLLLLTIVISILSVYFATRKTAWRVTGLWITGTSVAFLPLLFTNDQFELAHLFSIGIFVYIPLLLLGYSFVTFKFRLRMNPAIEVILALALIGVGIDAFFVDDAQSLCGHTKFHPAVLTFHPETVAVKVGQKTPPALDIRVRHIVSGYGPFSGDLANS